MPGCDCGKTPTDADMAELDARVRGEELEPQIAISAEELSHALETTSPPAEEAPEA